jgi:hypothetical protein
MIRSITGDVNNAVLVNKDKDEVDLLQLTKSLKEELPFDIFQLIFILLMRIDYTNVYFRALCDKSIMNMITEWSDITLSVELVCHPYPIIDFSLFKRIKSLKIIKENPNKRRGRVGARSLMSNVLFQRINAGQITTLHLANINSYDVMRPDDVSDYFPSLTELVLQNSLLYGVTGLKSLGLLRIDLKEHYITTREVQQLTYYDFNDIEHVEIYNVSVALLDGTVLEKRTGKTTFFKYSLKTRPSYQRKVTFYLESGKADGISPYALFTHDEIEIANHMTFLMEEHRQFFD